MKKLFVLAVIIVVGVSTWVGYREGSQEFPQKPPTSKNSTGLPLTLPLGFSISIFAKDLGSPRVLAWDTTGTLFVSIPGSGRVVALPDDNRDGVADETIPVVENLNRPHGLAFRDNKLYIAETNQVAIYEYNIQAKTATNKQKIIDLPSGGNHVTRTIGFGPDGKLYISVGSSCNVCIEKDGRRTKILVANNDGSDLKEYASGLRNTVFFTWHPGTRELWGTDMGRDLLGDNIPPEEINIINEGKHYGWPYCYGKQIHDKTFDASKKAEDFCKTTEPSHIEYQAHSAPLGLVFVPTSWPAEYRDDLLVAYHGSWNRTDPTGYKIMRMKLDAQGKYLGAEDFITGWLAPDGVLGRPVDVLFDGNGTLYISDDKAGVIYRVQFTR